MEFLHFLLSAATLLSVFYLCVHMPTRSTRYSGPTVVVDTSSLIDGRLLAVITSGFLQGTLLVPSSVLDELQLLADGKEAYKRMRARHGLEVLSRLQKSTQVSLRIVPMKNSQGADDDVLALALNRTCSLITTDYALLQRAAVVSVQGMNINDLAKSLQVRYAVGDVVSVSIEKLGEKQHQGLGHAEDGILVVVEDAAHSIGKTINVRVKHVSQTSSGCMLFGKSM